MAQRLRLGCVRTKAEMDEDQSLALRKQLARVRTWLVLLLILGGGLSSSCAAEAHALSSPDGKIQLSIEMPAAGSDERPRWSATFRGKPILSGCSLGLQIAEDGDLMAGARVVQHRSRSVDDLVPVWFGKSAHANDRFREIRFSLESRSHRLLELVFRCYNDAVAVRYELPALEQPGSVTITNEATSFALEGEPTGFVQYLEHFKTSHEHNVMATPYREIRRGVLVDLPLTFSWKDGTYAAITEAALRRYAGMSLLRASGPASSEDLVCQLTPRSDGTRVVGPLPLKTPWRVVLIGERPGALLESGTIYCLNDPPAVKDTSWIKPGKITFHWWNGDVYDGQPGAPILSFEMSRKYIDFCARNGDHDSLADFHRKDHHTLVSTVEPGCRARAGHRCDASAPGIRPAGDPALRGIRGRCGCGPGCTRPRFVAGLKRRSPRSKQWAGAG